MTRRLVAWAFVAGIALACVVRADSLPPQPVSREQITTALGYSATSTPPGTMYVSACPVTVNSQTPTSTFCPDGTDSTSATKRTYAAGALTVGRGFDLRGGGTYTVPTGNLRSADIAIKVGSATVMTLTTPAAPVGTNQGVEFYAICSVRSATTINCHGRFEFVVAGTSAPVSFDQTNTFDPSVANMVDVLGDWNGTTTTHSTVVTQAVLTALN